MNITKEMITQIAKTSYKEGFADGGLAIIEDKNITKCTFDDSYAAEFIEELFNKKQESTNAK